MESGQSAFLIEAPIIFDRDGRLPTIIVSQTTAAYWVQKFPDPVAADSLVSRLNTGQRVELGEYDMRHFLATQLETE